MSMSAFRKMKLQRDLQERKAMVENTAVTEEPVVAVPTVEPVVEATAKTDAEKLKKRK